jgi:hypothetical protein
MRLMGKWNWWSPKWLENLFTSSRKPQQSSAILASSDNANGQESE